MRLVQLKFVGRLVISEQVICEAFGVFDVYFKKRPFTIAVWTFRHRNDPISFGTEQCEPLVEEARLACVCLCRRGRPLPLVRRSVSFRARWHELDLLEGDSKCLQDF